MLAAALAPAFSLPAYTQEYWSTADLNIRNAPEGNIIGAYAPGQSVTVTEESGEWYKTEEGYVSAEYLTTDPAEVPDSADATDPAEVPDSADAADPAEVPDSMDVPDSAELPDPTAASDPEAREYLAFDEQEFPLTYTDDTLSVTIYRETGYGSVWYAADVILSDPDRMQTMFPGGAWGGHATAVQADREVGGSILMVNGDFRDPTNAQNLGIVRDGAIINDRPMKRDSIGITESGDLVPTKQKSPAEVLEMGVRDTWTFGPYLVKKGKAITHKKTELHPRTFFGQVEREDAKKEYWIIVADGRWEGYSDGLSQDAMTQILLDKGCRTGFNLDGGGSSIMLFQGKVVNRPSDGEQRENADYIYIR